MQLIRLLLVVVLATVVNAAVLRSQTIDLASRSPLSLEDYLYLKHC